MLHTLYFFVCDKTSLVSDKSFLVPHQPVARPRLRGGAQRSREEVRRIGDEDRQKTLVFRRTLVSCINMNINVP